MTVMNSSCDVADKAVSTEDTTDIVNLDAVLSALVESKVMAMKAASSSVLTAPSKGKWGSTPISPGRSRLTSSSTISSSQNHHRHRHDKDQPHHKKELCCNNNNNIRNHQRHRHKRYDSAPCETFIGELNSHNRRKSRRGHRRASELIQSSKYKNGYSKSSQVLPDDMYIGFNSPIELIGLDHNLSFINVKKPPEASNDNGLSIQNLELRPSSYLSQSAVHLGLGIDEDDYVALDIQDELDLDSLNCSNLGINDLPNDHYQRPRRKRKRKRKRGAHDMMTDMPEVMLVDHDELPPRARWTIVVTACLLFAMSILLVGVTLRMAPIIDDMVRKENEELLNSLNRDTAVIANSTITSP